ncbi:hypothetical protein ACU610_11115 [Geodermatophilus sp. URMC 61]
MNELLSGDPVRLEVFVIPDLEIGRVIPRGADREVLTPQRRAGT